MSRIHFFGASCPRDHGDGRVVMEAPLEAGGGPWMRTIKDVFVFCCVGLKCFPIPQCFCLPFTILFFFHTSLLGWFFPESAKMANT